MAAATSGPTLIDPNDIDHRYPFSLSTAIRENRQPERRYYSFRYNHKPRREASKTRKIVFNASTTAATSVAPTLHILDRVSTHAKVNPEDEDGKQYAYNGATLHSDNTEPFILIRDPGKNAFTLHALATAYAFNITDDSSHDDAIGGGDPFPFHELRNNFNQPNGVTQRYSISSAATSPAHSTEADVVSADEGDQSPDAGNPFDWRHHVNNLPGLSSDKPNGITSKPASITSTPISRLSSPYPRSSAPSQSSPSLAPSGPPPRSVPSNALSGRSQPPAKRQKREPDILRRPQTHNRARNISTATAPSQLSRPVTPSISVENATPDAVTTPTFKRHTTRPHSHSAPQAPSDPNELIIEGDDDRPSHRQQGIASPAFATPPSGRPMSLREAASRGASPLMPPRSQVGRRFADSAFARGLGIQGVKAGDDTTDIGDDGGVSGRSIGDGDVETDFELGSPAYALRSPDSVGSVTGKGRAETPAKSLLASPKRGLRSPEVAERVADAQEGREKARDMRERSNSIDELEHALHDALGGGDEQEREVTVQEDMQDDEGDLGDALAAALAAAGEEGGEEESEEE